ncbi:MAG: PKD domain-containing protein [Planctomycetota bacterium]
MKRSRRPRTRSLLTPLTMLLLLMTAWAVPAVRADTHTWNGDGDGYRWNDPDNWVEDEVPYTTSTGDDADAVVIDGAYDVFITQDVWAVTAVTIDGGATLTVESGLDLGTNSLTINDGGLILEEVGGVGADLRWAKANRGHFWVEADGYITGAGVVKTMTGGGGVYLLSTRSAEFDMTAITLNLAYKDATVRIGSSDLGRTADGWTASNYAIGKVILQDYRYDHHLYQADGSIGGGVNALYCFDLEFGGDWQKTTGGTLDLQGTNLYVRDQITWYDDSITDTPGELTVATAFDPADPTTAIWDDDVPQAVAYLGLPPNDAPVVDAGDDQLVTLPDNAYLDGSVSDDGLPDPPAAVTTTWTKSSGPGDVYFADPAAIDTRATFTVDGVYVLELAADDSDLTAADTVTITVDPATGGALTSSSDWQNASFAEQTAGFTAEFDAVPHAPGMDGVTGLCLGTADWWTDLACIFRFDTGGYVDVRNGGSYTRDVDIAYVVGDTYHVRMEVYLATHTYDVFVTPEGGAEVQLAANYDFRTEQADVASLDGWSLQSTAGSHTVSNMTVTPHNTPPVADAGPDQEVDDLDRDGSEEITLDGSASTDDGTIVSYVWEEAGVELATGVAPVVTLDNGEHTIDLTVTDDFNETDTDTVVITINDTYPLTHNFCGGGDGTSWHDPANWLEGTVPVTTSIGDNADPVVIDGAYDVRITQDVWAVTSVTIDGGATLTVESGLDLGTNSLTINSGGLILEEVGGIGADVRWAKANRGQFVVEADGYVAGTGVIRTLTGGSGTQLRSTRAADFDMTQIELQMAYQGGIHVASDDLGRDTLDGWAASNFAIGKIYFTDRRYGHALYNQDGSIGGGINALYCHELRFGGDADESANLDLQGINVYVRDQVTWGDGTVTDTEGQLTVATAFDPYDKTTALWDDDTPQGEAYIGVPPNLAPTADAGDDLAIVLGGPAVLDGTVTDDGMPDPPGTLTVTWSQQSGPGTAVFDDANAVDTTATFDLEGTYVLHLEADDSQLTATDTVTVTVDTPSATAWDWTGAGDGVTWSDPANWLEGTVPLTTSTGDDAGDVSINGTYDVSVDADVIAVHSVTLDGDAALTVEPAVTLRTNSLQVVNGGLILAESGGDTGFVGWGKMNRGSFAIEADGYVAGSGVIDTGTGSAGTQIRSTRAADFDMTGITLKVRYHGGIDVASADVGRADGSGWAASNFAIGKVHFLDRRYDHALYNQDGSIGGGVNALYCLELQFAGDADETAGMDLQGINAYIRDKLTWGDGSTIETPCEVPVATAKDPLIPTTAIYDDDTPQGQAWVGTEGGATNTAPSVDAGNDQTITLPADATLDGTVTDDGLPDPPAAVTTTWSKSSGPGTVTFGDAGAVDTTASFSTDGTYVLELEADDGALSASDTVTITVNPQGGGGGGPVSPLSLTNHLAGIDVTLSGTNGTDWAVEHTFHDGAVADQTIYLHSDVDIALAHNANNVLMKRDSIAWDTWDPIDGPDGVPDSGDEGDIHYKIDRDMQAHAYCGTTAIPSWAPLYSGPFDFDTLTYDGVTPVLGATGDNGGPWGSSPRGTTDRFAYGQLDAFGNEWHTLTYWDDDEPVYDSIPEDSHRQGASDGHWVYVCVNPITPVIQFVAPTDSDQYYTTPLKTYHVPKTWDQTTYLTSGVEIQWLNLTNAETVEYRVDGGAWQSFGSTRLVASDIIPANDTPTLLEFRNGPTGPVASRTIVMNPSIPGASETHGFLLWADADEKADITTKLTTIQPFATSYNTFKNSYYQSSGTVYTDQRGGWRSGAGMASKSLANAFAVAIDGPSAQPDLAALAKERLLRMARLEAVGFEKGVSQPTPSKDYLNELGQTIQQFADAGVAYDLLASCYRSTDDPDGMTPIEERRIRDGLAEIAKTILQVRANWSFTVGGGDTHWAHGYELAFGAIAAAMPAYATPYFGVSGGDMTTVNDLSEGGYYWNPFPDQGVTWYEAATDPSLDTPGHPNVKYPLRAEALITDIGYWTGPNDYQGDGDRYYDGVNRRQLVDLSSSGMANAECRVELVEMAGYESPFSRRLQVLDVIRRIKGDTDRQAGVTTYIRRRLMAGYVPVSWDSESKTYSAQTPWATGSLCAFNNHNEAASTPSAMDMMSTYLSDLNKYYGYESGTPTQDMEQARKNLYGAYTLALMWDPSQIDPHQPEPNHAPIIKPCLKHVVHPGEQLYKNLIIMDPDDDALTITVTGLPGGASYDSGTRTISWTPGTSDEGVYLATITADDGTTTTTAHWPMIVKADAPSGPIPSAPVSPTATLNGDDITVSWSAPSGVSVAYYIVWRDGAPAVVLPAGTTSWVDADRPARSHTRYHVSLLSDIGAESSAPVASPGYIYIP